MEIIDVLVVMSTVSIGCVAMLALKLMDTRTELKSLHSMQNTLIDEYLDLRARVIALEVKVPDEPVNIADEPEYVREDESMSANLSIQERILMRESEFDKRIKSILDEYGEIPPGTIIPYSKREYNPAQSLHPDVHNIPHEAVDLRDAQLPDVEVPKEDA
jgi:hypothetical protein